VQLVKDVLSLVNGIGGPTLVSWPGYFTPGAVMLAGSDSGLRLALALAGYHRDRRGCGAGRPRSPGYRPECNRGHRRQQRRASGMFGAIRFLMSRLLG